MADFYVSRGVRSNSPRRIFTCRFFKAFNVRDGFYTLKSLQYRKKQGRPKSNWINTVEKKIQDVSLLAQNKQGRKNVTELRPCSFGNERDTGE